MTKLIEPGARRGEVRAAASKSQAHRYLICAALTGHTVRVENAGSSQDIRATLACLSALLYADGGTRRLDCGESGTTLRFMLPLAGALGADAEFMLRGRLPERPIEPLARELCAHGMNIEHRGNILRCSGALRPGAFTLPGDVSSQFISGLLMALPMLPGDSTLNITGHLQSAPYVAMTLEALRLSRISVTETANGYHIPGGQSYDAPEMMTVEGDWSNAAPFLCMGALSHSGVAVTGLNPESVQGDRAIVQILRELGAVVEVCSDRVSVRRGTLHGAVIDAAMITDIIPALAALFAAADGETRIVNAGRLRLKESDRLGGTAKTVCHVISKIVVIVFSAVCFYFSFSIIQTQIMSGQVSPGLRVPMWIPYSALPLSFGIITIVQTVTLVLSFFTGKGDDIPEKKEAAE